MIKKLEELEKKVSIALFIMILVVVFWQIFSRKVLGSPSAWSDELSRLIFVYLGVLGTHLAQRENIHVRIDALMLAAPKRIQLAIELAINAVMSIIFIAIAIYGWKIVNNTGAQDYLVTLHISVAFLNFGLVFLGGIMAAEMIAQIVNIIRKGKVVRS